MDSALSSFINGALRGAVRSGVPSVGWEWLMQLQTMACGVVTSPSQVLSNSVIQWRLVEIEFEQYANIIGQ